jgi:8-oxo-dGTP pyrophosphatase MutT (NUDIX family)
MMTTPSATPAIPAATLVILREVPGAAPRLLMVERATAMAFAGGAMVFPGGRVDPRDHLLADLIGRPGEEGAARVAAIRETLEEVGLAIGLSLPPSPDAVVRLRAGLHRGGSFAELLTAEALAIDPDVLVPFARWCPAHGVSRIFDTRFYVVRATEDGAVPQVDGTENSRLVWLTAAEALAEAAAGWMTLIFPTRRNLERLAQFGSVAEIVADAGAHPVTTIIPWVERRGDGDQLCIPEGLGYPVTAEPVTRAARG